MQIFIPFLLLPLLFFGTAEANDFMLSTTNNGSCMGSSDNQTLLIAALKDKMDILELHQAELRTKMESMERRMDELRSAPVHEQMKLKPEIIIVDDTFGAGWFNNWENPPQSHVVITSRNSATFEKIGSIFSTSGFLTEPQTNSFNSSNNVVQFQFHYFEVNIDQMENYIVVGFTSYLSAERDIVVGEYTNSYGVDKDGAYLHANIYMNAKFAPDGFHQGDTMGAGLAVVQHGLISVSRWMFFTKNGKIWGTPVELSGNIPRTLSPAIGFRGAGKVTANFGTEPFKYKIPPAEDLVYV